MNTAFVKYIFDKHQEINNIPDADKAHRFLKDLLGLLFPQKRKNKPNSVEEVSENILNLKKNLCELLSVVLPANMESEKICDAFFDVLPSIYNSLEKDADSLTAGDPAAVDLNEVIACYPGFFAIATHRIAHQLYVQNVPLLPRILSENAHSQTGIDIHPGANIGEYFCIDHGTGLVVGETTVIGNNVKLYQGVTLGALSVNKEMAKQKRHPTIEDGVVIYSGATILGGDTVIGKNSIIGGNVWLTESIPENSRVYHQEQIIVKKD
jgi:serine O-acetyltransferase